MATISTGRFERSSTSSSSGRGGGETDDHDAARRGLLPALPEHVDQRGHHKNAAASPQGAEKDAELRSSSHERAI